MSKIYLLAVLCMVSAAAALPLDDGLTPQPKLPPGSEDVTTPKLNGLKPTVQDSKESKAEASNEQIQPNKLNLNGEEPQKVENSKELNKPDVSKEFGEDKIKGTSSEELVKGHDDSGEKRPGEPIQIKNPSLLMSYLNWLLGQSLLGSRSYFYERHPKIRIILPKHAVHRN